MSSQESNPLPTPPKSARAGQSQERNPVTPPPSTVRERRHEGELAPILSFIHKHFQTYNSDDPYAQEDLVACISASAEQELQQEIKEDPDLSDFVDKRVSYRWTSPEQEEKRGVLIIRMVTKLHATVTGSFCTHILKAGITTGMLPHVSTEAKDAANFNMLSEPYMQTIFKTSDDDKSAGRIPDAALMQESSGKTTLVLEVAYSEDEVEVYQKAAMLLQMGNGDLRTAVAIKLQYQSPEVRAREPAGEAYYVVHRWGDGVFKGRKVDVIRIRDADGNVSPGALELQLSDLCPPDVLSPNDDPKLDPHISIPHSTLNSWIETGHTRQRKADDEANKVVGSGRGNILPVELTFPTGHPKRPSTPELKRPDSGQEGRLRASKKRKTDSYKELSSDEVDGDGSVSAPGSSDPAQSPKDDSEENDETATADP